MNLRKLLGCSVCIIWLAGGIAVSETPLPTAKELAALTASHSPQPVRIGDLRDRKVILPLESHRVLGRVAGIVRLPDGQVNAVLNYGGFLGFATHPIAVPTDAIALLGADLVMLGYTPGPAPDVFKRWFHTSSAERRDQDGADRSVPLTDPSPFHPQTSRKGISMSDTSIGPASKTREPIPGGKRLHPPVIRIMHWTNAVAMLVMITSGWGIYNDNVVIDGLHFAHWMRLGAWGNESLLWHFAGMWLLAINGLCYLAYGLITGRLRERLMPIRIRDVVATVRDTLHLRIAHDDLTTYNAVQKLLYVLVILAGVSQVVTGLCLWQWVQFQWLVGVLGGFQAVRIEHFAGMSIICGFLVVHVLLSVFVPSTLWAMIAGGPRLARRSGRA